MSDKKLYTYVCQNSCDFAYNIMEKTWENYKDYFSEEAYGEHGFVLSCFDTGEDLWESTYQLTTGKSFSEEVKCSEEEVLTLTIATAARYTYTFGFDITETIGLLFKFRYKPQEYKDKWTLEQEDEKGKEWFGRFIGKEDPILLAQKVVLTHPEKKRFTDKKSREIAACFLHQLFQNYPKRFVDPQVDVVKQAFNEFFNENSGILLWKDAYAYAFGRELLNENPLTEEEIITVMIELCAMLIYKFDHKLEELLKILFWLRHTDIQETCYSEYAKEYTLWKETLMSYCK